MRLAARRKDRPSRLRNGLCRQNRLPELVVSMTAPYSLNGR